MHICGRKVNEIPPLDSISGLFYAQNAFAAGVPAGGAHSATPDPLVVGEGAGGEGARCPLPSPRIIPLLRAFGYRAPALWAERSHCSYFTKRPLRRTDRRTGNTRNAAYKTADGRIIRLNYAAHNNNIPVKALQIKYHQHVTVSSVFSKNIEHDYQVL